MLRGKSTSMVPDHVSLAKNYECPKAPSNIIASGTAMSYVMVVLKSLLIFSALTGGVLDNEFELWQFHAHWGSDDEQGSEHTVNGKMYPAEVNCKHTVDKKTQS